jgi:hypothetical protein
MLIAAYCTALTFTKMLKMEALQERDALFSAVFDESADAILLVHAHDDTIYDCNRRAVELFEAPSKTHLIGKAISDFQTDPTPAKLNEQDQLRLKQGETITHERAYKTYQGKTFLGDIATKQLKVGVPSSNS